MTARGRGGVDGWASTSLAQLEHNSISSNHIYLSINQDLFPLNTHTYIPRQSIIFLIVFVINLLRHKSKVAKHDGTTGNIIKE